MDRTSHEFQNLALPYLADISDEISQLTQRKDSVTSEDGLRKWISELARMSHRIKGSGGSYGFPTISAIAAELEGQCDAVKTLDHLKINQQDMEQLESKLNDLAHEIGQQQSTLGAEPQFPDTSHRDLHGGESCPNSHAHIVVIDEDKQIQTFISEALKRRLAAHSTCFSDWPSAEWFLQETRPDLILLSSTLPEHSVSQIAEAIRTQQTTKQVPIIFVTTERDMIDIVEAIRAGADDVLTKPFDARTLTNKIDLILEQARPKFLQILMVDDDPSLHTLVENAVQDVGFHVETLEDPTQTLQVLSETNPDLLLLDIDMPDMNGVEVCHAIRNHSKFQALPIIFLSSKDDELTTVIGLRAGADDYITKPFRVNELVARLQARVQRNELLTHQAHRDGLTQLYHNQYFQKQLSEIIFSSNRYKETFCLVMVDIDRFKNINDTHGHLVGDRMIQELAAFLNSRLRHSDLVARYGGDEFSILLQRITPYDCKKLFEILKDEFKSQKYYSDISGDSISVTLSVGISVYPHDGTSSNALIQAADQALYQSKQQGRDRVTMCNSDELRQGTP